MQLLRLILDGFKSFATRTEFTFHESISAIIGPNGCGKSNIVDAIRWVLGEQSPKSLRGSTMTDVIFSGTDSKKGRETAQVILELKGEEFSGKKTIKRRVDSSGQGHYSMDGHPCRLKDIKDLFLDSGVGSHGYALVGQGEVEDIILSNPLERRKFFDEVAGIYKIRIHKEEASASLEETERDLTRIRDIIQELKERERPLHREAEKAKEHRRLEEAIREREVNLLLHQFFKERETLEELKGLLDELEEDLLEKRRRRDLAVERARELREALEEKRDEQNDTQDSLALLRTRLQETENLYGLNQEKEKHLFAGEERINKDKKRIDDRLRELEKREDSLKDHGAEVALIVEEYSLSIKEKEGSLTSLKARRDALQEEKERYERLHYEDREHSFKREQSKEQLVREVEDNQKRKKTLLSHLLEVQEDLQVLLRKIQEKREEISNLEDSFYQMGEDLVLLERRQREAERDQEVTQKRVKELQKEFGGLTTRLQLLKEMESDYRGFFPGVRSLLKVKETKYPWRSEILGAIANLLSFQPSLKDAITAALGARGQNVVVREEKIAHKAISYLHQNSLGRVTFLPLDTIKVYRFQEREIREMKVPGILGPIVEHITYPKEVAGAIYHLLGRVVLAEDLNKASLLAKEFKYKLKIVTLKGDLLLPGGAVTGGTIQEKKGIYQRKGEIEDLKKRIETLGPKRKRMEGEEEELVREALHLKEKKEEKRGQIHRSDLQLTSLKEELLYLRREETKLKKKKQELSKERDAYEEKIQLLKESLSSIRREDHQAQDNQDYLQKIEESKRELTRLKEEEEEVHSSITSLQIKMATAKKEQEQYRERLEDLKREREKKRGEKKNLEEDLERILQESEKINHRQKVLKEDKSNYKDRLQEVESSLLLQQKEMEDLQKKSSEEEEDLHALREQVEGLSHRERSLNLKSTRSRVQLENLREKLEAYRFEVQEDSKPFYDLTSLRSEKQQINRLKEELEGLGTVNPKAVEEYRQVKERLTFLTNQSQDLLEAREAMKKVIKEIEDGMKERFLTTFEAINCSFQEVFSQLFQGGSASLLLSDEKDPLECGVEMMAQPPGKKLQNLTLMSGGEKALTAIALIFALLKVQPSPFYILDEIDASLDEANLERFVHYMEKCTTTQFIIITHRRQTMAMAHTLLGLTMKDGAISQLLSMDLKEREEQVV